MTLVGHQGFDGQGFAANVKTLGAFAFVGSWGGGRCPSLGVRVVDLHDPSAPTVVATTARFPGTSAEDIDPARVRTSAFAGDLLAVGVQRCSGSSAAPGGLALVDITDPADPRELSFFDTGRRSRGVHELDVVVQGERVLALLAVPGSSAQNDADLRIVDISNPRSPVPLSAWGPDLAGLPAEGIGCNRSIYAHSVKASPDGMRAFVSFWDAGLIMLDISDPARPRYLGRALEADSEGAVHSVDLTEGGLAVVAEEDDVFRSPRRLRLRVDGPGESVEVTACLAVGDADLDRLGVIQGPLRFAGSLCTAPPSDAAAAILLANGAGCSMAAKMKAALAGGASALIVISTERQPATVNLLGDGNLPVAQLGSEDGERLLRLAASGGTIQMPTSRVWGGVRVWDIQNPAQPALVSEFRTENASRFPAPGPGSYTVHNPVTMGRYVVFSWYADGVRIVDFADPSHPVEVASWVPPATPDPLRTFPDAADVWGVAMSGDLLLASDINGGLYVLRLAGLAPAR